MSGRGAKVEHDGGNDRRAHSKTAHFTEPSETTAGANRLPGFWSNSRGGEKMRQRYYEQAEQAGGINRRDRPTEDTDGASRSKGRGEKKCEVEKNRPVGQ